jgi:dTDP-4-dehydrorhamnose reductase
MITWLVTGASGLLGRELTALLTAEGEHVIGLARADLDITDTPAVTAALERYHPHVVINCAAWTAVDKAEEHEDAAYAVNGRAVADLAIACGSHECILVHLSSDYVFDGTVGAPYAENDPPRPSTAYGRTKLAGERAVRTTLPETSYVVRTAWLYGAHGPSFVRTMINHARMGRSVSVVNDQRGQPTWSADVARQLRALVTARAPAGIYHATSSGETTWFGLASEVYRHAGADPALVTPVAAAGYSRPARRPAYSVLAHGAWAGAGIGPIGSWQDALNRGFPAMLTASCESAA